MINPPDELLADLQSALPPEMEKSSKFPPVANGGGPGLYDTIDDDGPHTYDRADLDEGGMAGYEMPRSSTERSVTPEEVIRWREGRREGRREGERERGSESSVCLLCPCL